MSDDPQRFEIVHWVEAPVAEVYRYFTEAEKMALWHGVEVRLDARPGGAWWVRHANGSELEGVFEVLEPPHRVVFTWGFAEPGTGTGGGTTPPGSSRVEVRLTAEAAERTRIDLRHTGFAPGEPVDWGWRHFLPELSRAV